MARPKEFDRDEVLGRAMQLFWSRGYEATSMADLVDHLGIGRQSLYDTFGDKHALYLAALDHYVERSAAPPFECDVPVRKQLRMLFTSVIDRAVGEPERNCCLLILAAAERATVDDEVAARVAAASQRLEKVLTRRLTAAQRDGEIGSHHDPLALARFLTSAINGLQLTGRTARDRKHLEQIADTTLSLLG
ncbi:MAG TPA: TetR/AcrR family transcriptional regulator [Kofleriaceae bacterium]|nr:TetR/AcrR family transcriptional regulator [Kofleriaceae bacterium]